MILTPFLIVFGLIETIKCSEIKQKQVKVPLLKGEDDQFSLNHMNVLLQSLYNSCPLRKAIFEESKANEATNKMEVASTASNPLELIFAKMHYDIENRGIITEASIYFKDSYLKTLGTSVASNPFDFYHWITRDLFESPDYCKLLRWEFSTVKRSTESDSQVFIEDHLNVLPIQTDTFPSIQSYLDDFFETKSENVVVTADGDSHQKTLQISKELVNSPITAAFLINRNNEQPIEFKIEETITLPDEQVYELNSVIIFDPQEEKYSVCVKAKDSFWYRIQDDSFTKVTKETVLLSASKFGYMLFYLDSEFTLGACSPKPSEDLIMKSLTKSLTHGLTRTFQKKSNSPPLKPLALPTKSKNMSGNQLNFIAFNDASPSTLRSASHLSLPALPLNKTPPPVELDQLEDILVPRDLSGIQIDLFTNDPVTSQSECPKSIKELNSYNDDNNTIDNTYDNAFNDYALFTSSKTDSAVAYDGDDVELKYFDDFSTQKSRSRSSEHSVWSQNYLNQQTTSKTAESRRLFAGLLDLEIEFHESHSHNANTMITKEGDQREEDELVMLASLAKITKTVDEPIKSSNTKKHPKKQSSKIHSILSAGLFNRQPPKEKEQQKDDEKEETKEVGKKQKDTKRVNRYAKF